ncbi:MAG: SHOCT domain-containing protein [Streptosporangiaceae bacterium]
MFVRRRPLLRAAVVGGGAYAMGKRSAQRAAQDSSAQADQNAPASNQGGPPSGGRPPTEPSVTDQLAQLSQLHQQGSLSDSEFATAKTRLLGS